MGILLGPNVFDLVPFASDGTCPFISFDDTATAVVANASGSLSASGSTGRRLGGSGGSGAGCKWIHTWDGKHTLDVWSFAGAFGVTLMIMESGMHINFEKVRVPPPCLSLCCARAPIQRPLTRSLPVPASTGRPPRLASLYRRYHRYLPTPYSGDGINRGLLPWTYALSTHAHRTASRSRPTTTCSHRNVPGRLCDGLCFSPYLCRYLDQAVRRCEDVKLYGGADGIDWGICG